MLLPVPPHRPRVHPEAFIAPSADLIGRIVVEARASVWFHAVLRAEDEPITLGLDSNILDSHCVVHTDPGYTPSRWGGGSPWGTA